MKKMVWMMLMLAISYFSHGQSQNIKFNTYQANEVAWQTQYPDSYSIMTREEIALVEGRGQLVMESAMDEKLELDHANLLWLKKDQFNCFTSNLQPFDADRDGSYAMNQNLTYEALIDAYTSYGFQFDNSFGTEIIDGLEFHTMETKLYTSDRKKVLMTLVMYDRLIAGNKSLTFNISYNNETDKELLMNILHSSKFSIRN
jgi:hypothetical protein